MERDVPRNVDIAKVQSAKSIMVYKLLINKLIDGLID